MKDRVLNLLTALSLLLCLGAVLATLIAAREGGPYLRGYDLFPQRCPECGVTP